MNTVNPEFVPVVDALALSVWGDDGGFIPDEAINRTDSCFDQYTLTDFLMLMIPKMQGSLRKQGFDSYVIERAVDRVIDAILPYLLGKANPAVVENWSKWLFGNAKIAAKQEAHRNRHCTFGDPVTLLLRKVDELDEETLRQIDDALESLTWRQKQAVLLCKVEGKSVSQVAREMGCARGTVQHHLKRGLYLMGEILEKNSFAHSSTESSSGQGESPPVIPIRNLSIPQSRRPERRRKELHATTDHEAASLLQARPVTGEAA